MRSENHLSSNTNLYKVGTPKQMDTEIMALWRSTDEDVSFYEKRTSTLIAAAFHYLVYERDVEGLKLNDQVIQELVAIKSLMKVAVRQDVPIEYRKPLQDYLTTLPTINESMFSLTQGEIDALDVGVKATEHHSYCEMMVPAILSRLNNIDK